MFFIKIISSTSGIESDGSNSFREFHPALDFIGFMSLTLCCGNNPSSRFLPPEVVVTGRFFLSSLGLHKNGDNCHYIKKISI